MLTSSGTLEQRLLRMQQTLKQHRTDIQRLLVRTAVTPQHFVGESFAGPTTTTTTSHTTTTGTTTTGTTTTPTTTTTTVGPCVGDCEYVWFEALGRWQKQLDTCSGNSGCDCQYPNVNGSFDGQIVRMPCDNGGTTTTMTTTTSTTGTTTTGTTTTTAAPCTGSCTWSWTAPGNWQAVSNLCSGDAATCACVEPSADGLFFGDIRQTNCRCGTVGGDCRNTTSTSTTTSTTTTPTTTTTTPTTTTTTPTTTTTTPTTTTAGAGCLSDETWTWQGSYWSPNGNCTATCMPASPGSPGTFVGQTIVNACSPQPEGYAVYVSNGTAWVMSQTECQSGYSEAAPAFNGESSGTTITQACS